MNASGKFSSEKSPGICYHWSRETCPGFTKNIEFSVASIIPDNTEKGVDHA
jgi:hypothetical protein